MEKAITGAELNLKGPFKMEHYKKNKEALLAGDMDREAILCSISADIEKSCPEKAVEQVQQLLDANCNDVDALYLLSVAQLALGKDKEAADAARQVIALNPKCFAAYLTVAYFYKKTHQLQQQMMILQQMVDFAETICGRPPVNEIVSRAWRELAGGHVRLGNIDQCKQAYLKAGMTAVSEEQRWYDYSSYLMCTNYDAKLNNQQMLAEHQKYNTFFHSLLPLAKRSHPVRKKIRVGYISPDFCQHVVIYFAYSLLHNYDRNSFEVYCYRKGPEDDGTRQLMGSGTIWRDISGLSTRKAAQLVQQDEIDILVELAGHTANNCLPVLAYKPAPVQLCGIGYFNTTGLKSVDYFLTDHYVDPPGESDPFFSEKLLRLSRTHWCYTKRIEAPACVPAPCRENGYITFCCFNNFAKVTDQVLGLWAEIMRLVPKSRLVLKNAAFGNMYARLHILQRLGKSGLDLLRVEFRTATVTHMSEYQEMDIALDTMPYVGGATTCEALYMGVPVITLKGGRHGARFGVSILENIGFPEWIAQNEAQYIEKAVQLAGETAFLDQLHRGELRERMESSPLMDAGLYMQDLERAYKEIWNNRAH